MFSGFWGWFIVIVLVVAVFSADRLPDLKQLFEKTTKEGLEVIKQSKKKLIQRKPGKKKNSDTESENE